MSLDPDMILINGDIVTMDPKNPRCEALAVKNQRIAKIGGSAEIEKLKGAETEIIDLKNKSAVPGFIDPHQHLFSYGITIKTWVDLADTSSGEEILNRVAARAPSFKKGQWILGRGWSEESLKDGKIPTRWELDEITPENPIALKDISGHYCISNSMALKLSGVTKDTPQPKSGWIDRDLDTGEPNGVFREAAMDFVWNLSPPTTKEQIQEAVMLGSKHANSFGLTSVHTVGIPLPRGAGYTAEELGSYVNLNINKELTVRTYLLIPVWKHAHRPDDTQMLDHMMELGLKTGFGDSMLKIGAAKIFVDGSLNARSASLYEPYSDNPSTSGMLFYTQEELDRVVKKAHDAGFQLAIHAHGDKGIELALNSVEKALRENPRENHRHRIKHVELLHDEQIERIKKLDLIVTSIPSSAGFSPWFQKMAKLRVGENRVKFLHRYKDLLDIGVTVIGGTDGHPIGRYLSPLLGLRDRVKVAGFTLEQAMQAATIKSAYASFEENEKGSIEEGKLADLVVLDKNPLKIDVDEIPQIRIEKTIVGGKIVYDNPASV